MRTALLVAIVVLAACQDRPVTQPIAAAPRDATSAPAADAATASERWYGEIAQPARPVLAFELRVERTDPPRATMAIPAQQLAATALVDVTCTDTRMTFTLALPGMTDVQRARFEVDRAPDGTARGLLHQHGLDLPVTMRRLAEGEEAPTGPRRPQTPRPPYPYDERPAIYASRDGTRLAGTLTVPRGAGPFPAVVLITGTGTQDREETLYGHQPFWVLADHLSRHGVAVLRVDDRGAGGSGGSTDDSGLDAKVDDVLAGVAWLAGQPGIDPGRIGLVGHSEGGVIAPMAAVRATTPGIAFLVLLAAPGVSGGELAVHQLERTLRAEGVAPTLLAARLAGQRRLVELSIRGADDATLHQAIVDHVAELAALPGVGMDARAQAQLVAQWYAPLRTIASREFLRSDPRPFLRQVRVPVLALWGSLDLLVDPAQNEPPVRAALADDADATTRVLPELNHMLQPAVTGRTEEFATIETTIAPAVLDAVTAWLADHAAAPAPPR